MNDAIESTELNNKSNDCSVHKIVELMANMINYLNVSLYEGQFTHNHEQSRSKLNEIYDYVSKMPFCSPSLDDSVDFYNNVKWLKSVTDTDDPYYYLYMRELNNYIVLLKSRLLQKTK